MKVLVIGGGIVGLSVAWACARRGHAVELFEQGPLPNPLASSYDDSRLIRYPYGPKHNYAAMVGDAFRANAALFADLGTDFFRPTGTLLLARDDDPWADASATSLAELGIEADILTPAQLAVRFPLLDVSAVSWALHTDSGGVLLARALLEAVAGWLGRRAGTKLHVTRRVTRIDPDGASLVTADGERVTGDLLVVAAGPWTGGLIQALAAELTPSRQIVVDLETDAERHAMWARMPMVLDGVASMGSGFYAVPPVDGHPIKIGDHRFSMQGHPDVDPTVAEAERSAILALARCGLDEPAAYRPIGARRCFYTAAAEERFRALVIGATLVLAGFSGHGFKFGPLIGLAVNAWIEGRVAADILAQWLGGRSSQRPLGIDEDIGPSGTRFGSKT